MREGVDIQFEKYRRHKTKEQVELLYLNYDEVEEDKLNFRVKLDIEVQIVAQLPDKEYGEHEFSFRDNYFMNDFDEYVDEDNIDEVLNKAVGEIKKYIRRPR